MEELVQKKGRKQDGNSSENSGALNSGSAERFDICSMYKCENGMVCSHEFIEKKTKWLNTKEAAEYYRTSPKQIRKWVYQGRIKAFKLLGKSLRFKKSDLDFLLEGDSKWE